MSRRTSPNPLKADLLFLKMWRTSVDQIQQKPLYLAIPARKLGVNRYSSDFFQMIFQQKLETSGKRAEADHLAFHTSRLKLVPDLSLDR